MDFVIYDGGSPVYAGDTKKIVVLQKDLGTEETTVWQIKAATAGRKRRRA
jgi:hypothetical protein